MIPASSTPTGRFMEVRGLLYIAVRGVALTHAENADTVLYIPFVDARAWRKIAIHKQRAEDRQK